MSVVVVVRKGGRAAICSDTLTTQGSLRLPGDSRLSPNKIHRVGRAFLGVTGATAHHRVIRSLLTHYPDQFDFASADAIYESFRALHPILKEEHYLLTDEDDDDQEYESNQLFGVICGPAGIFSFQSYREVTEHTSYWATGSGADIALGALHATYESRRSAKEIAEVAVQAACYHDKDCGLPLETHTVALAD